MELTSSDTIFVKAEHSDISRKDDKKMKKPYIAAASEILADKFGVSRMAVVGGPVINTAFLTAGLLDEISILMGAGIDGRGGMPAFFDGLDKEHSVIPLTLDSVQKFQSGAVWLRYRV